jgi:hypothetical protein
MSDERQDEEWTLQVINVKRICVGNGLWIDVDRGDLLIWGADGWYMESECPREKTDLVHLSIDAARELRTALGLAIAAAEGPRRPSPKDRG